MYSYLGMLQAPYNMERLLYLFSGMDDALISSLMETFETSKAVKVPEELRHKVQISFICFQLHASL